MPDFVQIGLPSSTASSMEIGSTLVPDQVDWGTDLLNQRYVQTVQAQGGIQAVELAPNRKITLPFIFKGASPDAANQYISALDYVTVPGNIIDVLPEGASWITRFDIEGGRVLAHRDIRYHRQGIIQGTLELSTRPWGYTPTWMIAASVTGQKPWIPFTASVIGDLPAHSRWNFYFKPAAGAVTNQGGLVLGQHAMPSYRTIWGAQVGPAAASRGFETLAANPSTPVWDTSAWTASSISQRIDFAQFNVSGEPELQNMASSTRVFVHANYAAGSVAGGFGMQLVYGARVISRPAYPIKPLGSQPIEGQLFDFGEIGKTQLVSPDGVATQLRLGILPVYDSTVASSANKMCYVDAMIAIPNAGIFSINNPLNTAGVPGDTWGQGAVSSSYQIWIDTKLQRMWRFINGGSAISNELTPFARGGWPLLRTQGASGNTGLVVGPLAVDPEGVSIPYAQASTTMQIQVTYQPRWLLFR